MLLCWLLQPISHGMGRDFIAKTVRINLLDDNHQAIRKFSVSPEKLQLLRQESAYFKKLSPEFFNNRSMISLPIADVDQETLALLSGTLHANQVRVQFVDENNEIVKGITLSSEQLKLLQKESLFVQRERSGSFKKEDTISLPVENVAPDAFDLILRLLPQNKLNIEQSLNKVAPELIFHLILAINFLDIDKLKTIALSKQKIQELASYLMEQKDKLAQLTMPAKYTMCTPTSLYPLTVKNSLTIKFASNLLTMGGFSPDGQYIVAGFKGGKAHIWNVFTGKIERTLSSSKVHSVHSISWSPDSKRVITVSEGGIGSIWNISTGKVEHTLDGNIRSIGSEEDIRPVSWSPDGSKIATVSKSGMAYVWNAFTGQQEYILTEGMIDIPMIDISWSPDGEHIITTNVGFNGRVYVWNVSTRQLEHTLIGQTKYAKALWSPNSEHISTVSFGDIRIWNASTGKEEHVLSSDATFINPSWSPDGQRFAGQGTYESVYIWNASTGEREHVFKGKLCGAPWSSDGKHIITSHYIGNKGVSISVYNMFTGQQEYILREQKDSYISWCSFGGEHIAAAYNSGIYIWSRLPPVPDHIGLDELLISIALLNGATIDDDIFNTLSSNSIDLLLSVDSQMDPAMRKALTRIRAKRPAPEMSEEAATLQPPAKKQKTHDEASSSSSQ